jgi:hypothetical protein
VTAIAILPQSSALKKIRAGYEGRGRGEEFGPEKRKGGVEKQDLH